MHVQFLKHFSKDLDSITQFKDRNEILDLIHLIKDAASLEQIPGVKKLHGFKNAYRIRSGNYRIGIFLDGDTLLLARVAHRKDIYRIFP